MRHILLDNLVDAMVEGEPIDWDSVEQSLKRLDIQEGEKRLILQLKVVYAISKAWEEINAPNSTYGRRRG